MISILAVVFVPASRAFQPVPLRSSPRMPPPRMFDGSDDKQKLESPITIIAKVIAQADIVGYEDPRKITRPPITPADRSPTPPPSPLPTREIDRTTVHPLLKLVDNEELLTALLALPRPLALSLALPVVIAALPALMLLVAARKAEWERARLASAREHKPAFDAAWQEYLTTQRRLVDELLAARASGARDPALPPVGAAQTIAVTMATGQEGQAVVKALSAAAQHAGTTIRTPDRSNPA